MSEEVVWSVLDALRGQPRTPETGISILQVFAWAKLSRDGRIPNDLSFTDATAQPSPVQYMRDCFQKLDKTPDTPLAFSAPAQSAHQQEGLGEIIRIISSAYKAGKIDFAEVASATLASMADRAVPFVETFLARLMVELSGMDETDRVYCPFDGSYSIATAAAKVSEHVITEVNSRPSPTPLLINILEDRNINPTYSDPIFSPGCTTGDRLEKFEISLAFPPIGVRIDPKKLEDWYGRFAFRSAFGELYAIQHVMAQTSKKAVVCVPNGVLFRSAQTERQFRQRLIEEGYLETVISLPKDILRPSSSVACSLLVLDCEQKAREVLLVDAGNMLKLRGLRLTGTGKPTEKIFNGERVLDLIHHRTDTNESAVVTFPELEKNDFNLVADRYILTDEQRGIMAELKQTELRALEEIATLVRPQSLRKLKEAEGETYFEVWPSDAPDGGYLQQPDREVVLSKGQLEKAARQAVKRSDILLSTKGTIGSVALAAPDFEGHWLPSQSQLIIRLNSDSGIDPRALYMYFRSEVFQSLLNSLATGATIKMIQMADLRKLAIPVMSRDLQDELIAAFEELASFVNDIKELQHNSEQLLKRHWSLQTESAGDE